MTAATGVVVRPSAGSGAADALQVMGAADRAVAVLAAATLLSGLSAVTMDRSQAHRTIAATGCVDTPCAVEDEPVRQPAPVLVQPTAAPRPPLVVPTPAPRPKVAAQPKPAPARPAAKAIPRPAPTRSAPKRVQLMRTTEAPDPATAAAIKAMRLTPAGYRVFLERVDQSSYDYAQQFVEFDPNRVAIEQRAGQVFVWHFTTFYRNADGPGATPVGDMEMRPFIQGMAERGDEDNPPNRVCCGVNWVIDRHGPAHQLAPVNAKLRHNPPYDSINTGVEIEAARQADITTDQYESLAYLTIAVLENQDLLGRKPLSEIAKGHGEMRDAYVSSHPDTQLDSRDDFNQPESRLIRQAIDRFLRAYPEVPRRTPRLR